MQPPADLPALEVTGLDKSFGGTRALREVSLCVPAGSVHGLLGRNGAGKSTLLRVLLGLVRPDSGRVTVLGRSVDGVDRAPSKGVAGFVDRPRFYPYLSGRDTLRILGDLDGVGVGDARVDEVLDIVGLRGSGQRRVSGWSTGMLQRLALAAALLRSPRLIVLDEPTEGLDPAGVRDLHRLLGELRKAGTTVLLSSHDMTEVEMLCDAVTILRAGRVVQSATVAELRAEAPEGSYRLTTSDDPGARRAAREADLDVVDHPAGGLAVRASAAALDDLTLRLGRGGIAIRSLEPDVAPLTAAFLALTAPEEK